MQIQNQFYQCKPSWALPFFSFNKILITYPKKKKKKKNRERPELLLYHMKQETVWQNKAVTCCFHQRA